MIHTLFANPITIYSFFTSIILTPLFIAGDVTTRKLNFYIPTPDIIISYVTNECILAMVVYFLVCWLVTRSGKPQSKFLSYFQTCHELINVFSVDTYSDVSQFFYRK